MKLSDYLQILSRRKWVIVFATLITVAAVAFRTSTLERTYSASTTVRVLTASIGSFDYVQYDLTYTDRLMNTYAQIAQSNSVVQQLTDQLGLTAPPNIIVNVIPETELMQIGISDVDPVRAKTAADALTAILIENVETSAEGSSQAATEILGAQLQQAQRDLDQVRAQYAELLQLYNEDDERVIALGRTVQLKEQIYGTLLDQYERARSTEVIRSNTLSVVESASVPLMPSSPNVPLNTALGLIIGLTAGLALAFLLENLDTTLHSSKQIESSLNLKTLGRIPRMRNKNLTIKNGDTPQAEAYRSLRTSLLNLSSETPLRTLAITSAEPNEGKSTIAAHLAIVIAQTGRNVVLVDCDLRRPRQHQLFNCQNVLGLSQLLTESALLVEVLQRSHPSNVTLMTSGVLSEAGHPAELLGSDNMARLLRKLSELYDLVILDLPASRVLADASIVSSMVDGVLLVVGRNLVKEQEAQDAYQQLRDVNATVIGMVINRAESNHNYAYYTRSTAQRATFQVADD